MLARRTTRLQEVKVNQKMVRTVLTVVLLFSLACCCIAVCEPAECGDNGACENDICICTDGFGGEDCADDCTTLTCNPNLCVNDEALACAECEPACILPGGTCKAYDDGTAHGVKCICNDGYIGDNCGTQCPECQNGGTCIEGGAGRTTAICSCLPTHTGDTCELECPICLNGGTCIKDVASRSTAICSCLPTHTGDTCELVECADSTPCHYVGGQCQESTCSCNPNYAGDDCSKECKPPCTDGRQCFETEDRSGAECLATECSPTCTVYQTCVEDTSSRAWECECKNGLSGEDCKTIDDCASTTLCMNDANCVEKSCNCTANYAGTICQHLCSPTCSAGQTCSVKADDTGAQCSGGAMTILAGLWIFAVAACNALKLA